MKYTPLLQPRAWQRRLHYGRFRRNSNLLKPVIWLLQQNQVRKIHAAGSVRERTIARV